MMLLFQFMLICYIEIAEFFQNFKKTKFYVEFSELNTIVSQMFKQKEESKTTASAFLFSVTGN